MYRKITFRLGEQEIEMFVKCTEKSTPSNIRRKARKEFMENVKIEIE